MKNLRIVLLLVLVFSGAVYASGKGEDASHDYDEIVMMPYEARDADWIVPEGGALGMLHLFSEELGLSEEQEKEIIRIGAEYRKLVEGLEIHIDQIELDIRKKQYQEVPLEELKPLIGQKYTLFAELEWIELRRIEQETAILSEEQRELWAVMEQQFFYMPMEEFWEDDNHQGEDLSGDD